MPSDVPAMKAAIAKGDAIAVQRLVAENPDLAKDWRAVMEAALHGDLPILRRLLGAGADPNAVSVSEARHRPLHRCIEPKTSIKPRADRVETVSMLLAAGAEVDAPGCWYDGRPLETAARAGDAQVAARLLAADARRDVFAAALAGDEPLLSQLIRAAPGSASLPDEGGAEPLHRLCASLLAQASAVAMAERLLAAGASAGAVARMRHGSFPVMHFACFGGAAVPDLLRLLVGAGARADDGLYEALWSGDLSGAGVLVELGASVDSWSHVSDRPMVSDMIQWGRNRAVSWLLDRGADPNQADRAGRTPLHFAFSRGAPTALIETLQAAGADPARRDAEGRRPREVAKSKALA